MLGRRKVSIIGAGHVGESAAFILAVKNIAEEIVMLDIVPNMPQGKALDMMHAAPLLGYDARIIGTNNYEDIKDSDVVIMTAGFPRKPGMSRDDLLSQNIPIMKSAALEIKRYAPDTVVIVVANPLDAMCYACKNITQFPDNRVIGFAGVLDSARFIAFMGMESQVSVRDIAGITLGSHGDDMVPLPRFALIGGGPVGKFIAKDRLDAIIERTRMAGGEIVKLLGTSAYWAPAAGAALMAEAILRDAKRIMVCHALLHGEYGVKDLFVGVPVKLGKNGVEQIIEIELTAEEMALFKKSADHVKEICDAVDRLGLLK